MKKEVTKRITLSAEWEEQEFVQLTWPHEKTDWAPMLDEITATYIEMAQAISEREKLLIVAPDVEKVKRLLAEHLTTQQMSNVVYHQCPTNDTWARDHAFLTLSDGTLLDFCFNGWGEKFEASLDNAINRSLYSSLFTLHSSLLTLHSTSPTSTLSSRAAQ